LPKPLRAFRRIAHSTPCKEPGKGYYQLGYFKRQATLEPTNA